jgi:hypothetical protein
MPKTGKLRSSDPSMLFRSKCSATFEEEERERGRPAGF